MLPISHINIIMEKTSYDLIIIGAGPGGYEAAKIAADRGLSTALISKTKIGGRATFGSLLPSKIWLHAADHIRQLKAASKHLIKLDQFNLDLEGLKQSITDKSSRYSNQLTENLKQINVAIFNGTGILKDKHTVLLKREGEEDRTLEATNIIIASGSNPRFTPDIKPNKDRILAPKLAPLLPKIPDTMLIIGGGVTGMEYAYAFAELGTKITVLHNKRHILSAMDSEVADYLEKIFQDKYDMAFNKGIKVKKVVQEGHKVLATLESGEVFSADYAFIAIGRVPDRSFYDEASLEMNWLDNGALKVNSYGHTGMGNIHAVGDITGIPMMANKAILQAKIAVRHILKDVDYPERYHFISATYCYPPMAQIESTKKDGHCDIITKPYSKLLRAQINGETEGILKLKVDPDTDLIKGVCGLGPNIHEILAIVQIAMEHNIPYDELITTHFANPSFTELVSMEIPEIKE